MRLKWTALWMVVVAMTACSTMRGANVILIVVDTLRADHLSLGGYARETSPRLEEFARRGTYFDNFHSHSSWTRASVATLLTSLMPRAHGIHTSGDALPRSLTTLPELLRDAGYETFAFVANPQIHPQLGFDQGFEQFDALYSGMKSTGEIDPGTLLASASDAQVLAKALPILLAERRKAYFAYIHLLDPHGPYTPDPSDAALFCDPSYAGDFVGSIGDFTRIAELQQSPADRAHFVDLYDAEIRGTDRDLGQFFDRLDQAGALRNTHILVTADHGEEFLEHGGTGHGRKLHEEQIHIPLLWLGPGVPAGRRVHSLGGLIDIVPTLIDLLDLTPREMRLQGESLRPLWTAEAPANGRAVALEEFSGATETVGGRLLPFIGRGLLADRHKLLADPIRLDQQRIGELAVFDLETDPGELRPRRLGSDAAGWSAADAALVARFLRSDRASARLASGESSPAGPLPPEDLERLRSLGYLD